MTFSIVANDPDARVCGAAVASCSVAVGGTVTYSRVGVINTHMVQVFEQSAGATLGERLLLALRAGDRNGGDRRGRQAAAISVTPHRDTKVAINLDLRVDDHSGPIDELSRLHELFRREFRE